MAHKAQLDFFATILNCSQLSERPLKILEIGSLDINGTTRQLCGDLQISEYIGIDLGAGPGVDVVASGHDYLSDLKEQFDLILSAECLEHNPKWRETIENSIRLLKPDGMLIFSWATTGRAEHGTHNNSPESAPFIVQDYKSYYRNVSYRDIKKIKQREDFTYEAILINFEHKDMYWVASKCTYDEVPKVQYSANKFLELLSEINQKWNNDYENLLAKKMRKNLDGFMRNSMWFHRSTRKIKIRIKEKRLRPKLIVHLSRINRKSLIKKMQFREYLR
jgi:SAM-dependent methyltransferase